MVKLAPELASFQSNLRLKGSLLRQGLSLNWQNHIVTREFSYIVWGEIKADAVLKARSKKAKGISNQTTL
jgi:hypothetical protein